MEFYKQRIEEVEQYYQEKLREALQIGTDAAEVIGAGYEEIQEMK